MEFCLGGLQEVALLNSLFLLVELKICLVDGLEEGVCELLVMVFLEGKGSVVLHQVSSTSL